MTSLANSRIAKWDNAKAFLILVVVFGHGLSPFINDDVTKWADLWLNSFHMPLFVFLGGMFSKKNIDTVPFKYDKAVGFLLLSLFMKLLSFLSVLLCGGNASFSLFEENGVAWYIFAMAIHLMIAHLLRSFSHGKVLVTSILLAMGAGYIDQIGNTLVLSRIIVFFPIFYLGYLTDQNKLFEILNKKWIRICSLILFMGFTVGIFLVIDKIYSLRYVLTGNNPYYEFGEDWYPFGALLRLGCYALSAVPGFAILSITPNKKLPLVTHCGTKTLQIYALHRAIQTVLDYTFLKDLLSPLRSKYILLITLGISVVLTLVLSLKPFEYIIYPCTNWRKFFAPVINWYKNKQTTE